MKKTITIMSLGIVFSGIAQNQISVKNSIPFKAADRTTSESFGRSNTNLHYNSNPIQKAVLLQEDFESVTAPALPSGFTTQTQAASPYTGFYTGTAAQANAGGFWPVPSNGSSLFAMTNDDINDGDLCEERLVLPTLDFTGQTNVGFEFDAFHDKNYGSGDAEVQVSLNGGTSWTTLLVLTVDAANWQHFAVPLTAYDNTANVTLALFWNDGGDCTPTSGGGGNWGTGLAVDNLIVQTIANNNLTANSLLPADITTDYEYTKLPLTQTRPLGMSFNISNNGLNDQPDVGFSYVISNGTPVNSGNSATSAINSFASDTLYHTSSYTPSALGNYTITATATMAATDEVPTDNVATSAVEITNNVWARDYTTFDGSFRNISGANGNGVKLGHVFLTSAAQTFSTVQIGISNSTAHEGKLFFGEVYTWDGSQWVFIAATEDRTLVNATDGGQIVNLCLVPEANLPAGAEVLVVAGHYGGAVDASDHVRFATAGSAREGTVLGFDGTGSPFQLLSPPAIVVRLASTCVASIEETVGSMTLGQNSPNPFNGTSVINYSLASTEDITFEITDMTGKLVKVVREGVKTAGTYTVTIDGNELSEGMYFYTITNGTSRVTKSMVITK